MVSTVFVLFLVSMSTFVLLAGRKEVPVIVLLHALVQYAFTLAQWAFRLNDYLSGMLLGFIILSSLLLFWGRSMNYSNELHSVRLFFTMGQWVLLLGLVLYMGLKSPYYYVIPSSSWHPDIPMHRLSIQPVLKLGGNLLIFTTFFQLVLHWGQRWPLRRSLADLGPLLLYALGMVILEMLQSARSAIPFT
ncbi:MAG: hypothetical protein OHK0039_13980 [Bacteroidia bacterium]